MSDKVDAKSSVEERNTAPAPAAPTTPAEPVATAAPAAPPAPPAAPKPSAFGRAPPPPLDDRQQAVVRGRIRIIGGMFVVLSLLLATLFVLYGTNEDRYFDAGAKSEGGNFDLIAYSADATATPIPEAVVTLRDVNGTIIATAKTGPDGHLRMDSPRGTFDVTVSDQGVNTTHRAFVPQGTKEVRLKVFLDGTSSTSPLLGVDPVTPGTYSNLIPPLVLLAGGIAMLLLRVRLLGLTACVICAVMGVQTLLGGIGGGGGILLFMAVPLAGIGIWGFSLIRKGQALFR